MAKKKTRTSARTRTALAELSPREIRFCHNYAAGKPAYRSYLNAGFDRTTLGSARTDSSKLLTKSHIQEYIAALREDAAEQAVDEIRRKVVNELVAIGFADIGDVVNEDDSIRKICDLEPSVRAAIAQYEVTETVTQDDDDSPPVLVTRKKLRFHDKIKALVTLGEYLGILGPKSEPKRADDGESVRVREIVIRSREEAAAFLGLGDRDPVRAIDGPGPVPGQ